MNRQTLFGWILSLGLIVAFTGCNQQEEEEVAQHPSEINDVPVKKEDVPKETRDAMKKSASSRPMQMGGSFQGSPDQGSGQGQGAADLAKKFTKHMKGGKDKGPSGDLVRVIFGRFDTNKNGKLERKEIPKEQQKLLLGSDINKDGVITKSELSSAMKSKGGAMGAGLPMAGGGSVGKGRAPTRGGGPAEGGASVSMSLSQLDANKDGKVELKELGQFKQLFAGLDKNKDGVISKSEYAARKKVGGFGASSFPNGQLESGTGGAGASGAAFGRQFLAALDKNRDGKIAADEVPLQARKRVMAADTNKDGFVDQAEFNKAFASNGGPGGRGGLGGGVGGGLGLIPGGPPKNGNARRIQGGQAGKKRKATSRRRSSRSRRSRRPPR